MREFKTVDDKYLLKSLRLDDGLIVQIRIRINQTDFERPENINWDIVDSVLELLVNNTQEHLIKATEFINFLIEKSELYDKSTIEKIKGFKLISLEIIDCFGKHLMTMYSRYRLQFDFVSDYWVYTYGQLYVTFMNKHVIGVERIQV